MLRKTTLILPWLGDFGQGMLAVTILSYLFGVPLTIEMVVFALVFSIIPDLDGVFELLSFGNIAAGKGRTGDHRTGLHYPLIWILVGLGWIVIDPFWGTLALVCVVMHFINDLWGIGWGVQFFWPFSKRWYKLDVRIQTHGAPLSSSVSITPEEKNEVVETHGNLNWLADIYYRLTWISVIEYSLFLGGLVAVTTTMFLQ